VLQPLDRTPKLREQVLDGRSDDSETECRLLVRHLLRKAVRDVLQPQPIPGLRLQRVAQHQRTGDQRLARFASEDAQLGVPTDSLPAQDTRRPSWAGRYSSSTA